MSENKIPTLLVTPPWKDKSFGIRKPKALDNIDMTKYPSLWLTNGEKVPSEYAKNLIGILQKSDIKHAQLPISKSQLHQITSALTADSLQDFAKALVINQGIHSLYYAWICELETCHIDEIRAFIDVNKFDGGDTLACRDLLRVLAISCEFTHSMPALRELLFQHTKGKKRFRSLANDLINKVSRSFDSYYTYEDLLDYATPTFGFNSNGTMSILFSDKTVIVKLDNHLTPTLFLKGSHEQGQHTTLIKNLPRVTKNDNKEDFQQKKADYKKTIRDINKLYKQKVKTLSAELHTPIYRKTTQFLTIYLKNPLLNLMAQSLVWGIYKNESSKELLEAFVIANDGDWLDSHYNTINKADFSHNYITLIHPAYLDDSEQIRFQDILNDFHIIQPFEQMFMQVFRLSKKEHQDKIITRFQDKTLSGEYFAELIPSVVNWNYESGSYDYVGFNFYKPLNPSYSYYSNDLDYLTINFIEKTTARSASFQIQDIDITSCDDPVDLHTALLHLSQSVITNDNV